MSESAAADDDVLPTFRRGPSDPMGIESLVGAP